MSERHAVSRSPVAQVTTTLRSVRMRSLAPRMLLYAAVAMLCAAGLRATLAGPRVAAPAPARGVDADLGAQAFAEGFVRAYLTWDGRHLDRRSRALEAYLPAGLSEDAGVTPARRSRQGVDWTSVSGAERRGNRMTVGVVAGTTGGVVHLAVPVEHDARGFLYVAGYPALVGPPLVQRDVTLREGNDVDDASLETVVTRAIRNYLGAADENLRADLTSDAVVALPSQRLTVTSADRVTWVTPNRRVAVEVQARDAARTTWTLRYELDVRKRDRWYVRSIESDQTKEEVVR